MGVVPELTGLQNSAQSAHPGVSLSDQANSPYHAETATPSERLYWVDTLKGIGIICVVIGHLYANSFAGFLYLFHMPLFFIVSGYLLRPEADLRAYALRKARHLLIPYLSFLVLLYPVDFYTALTDGSPHTLRFDLRLVAVPILGGKLLSGATSIFWFVTCLFLTQQIVNFLVVRLSRQRVLLLMAVFLALAYANALLLPGFWLPWGTNIVLAAAPLFYLGYLARERRLHAPLWISLLLALLALALYMADSLDTPDMKSTHYGTPIFTLIFSVAWVALLADLSRRLSAIPYLHSGLEALGAASMAVMYLHEVLRIFLQSALHLADLTLCLICEVLGSYLIYLVLKRFTLTRTLFLGARA